MLPYKLTSWSANCSQWRNFGIVSTVDGCMVNSIILCHSFNTGSGLQIKFTDLCSHQNVALARSLVSCLIDGRNIVSLKTGVIQCQCSLWHWILCNDISKIWRSCLLPIFYHCNPSILSSFSPFLFSTTIRKHQLYALGPRFRAVSKPDSGLLLIFSKV